MSVAGLYSQVSKLSLSTPRRRRGGEKVQLHSLFTSAALLPVPIHLEAGRFDQVKKLLTLSGFETQHIQPQNLVTVQTQLPRLPSNRIP
jgi:hypothetical protein